MLIREFQPSDQPAIQQLFYDTVRRVNCRDYGAEQVEVWSASARNDAFWQTRLRTRLTFVAEDNQQIVGFAMLARNGYIDCFYCHAEHQGKGIGTQLLKQIETTAQVLGIKQLFSEVSITAKPFFQHWGYVVVREQQVERQGVSFCNFVMEKYLETKYLQE